ncbi:alpha/beta hydrolase [Paenibacillus piri]|uniref:Esterase family protein n=1 Tax=Paenibacillus piri TaxID=2547395 RepID=A0A4R5KWU4_9BACL|nr:alpha/beta hydrolase family protein [Paenibacillus piri]TDF99625.1 esterase family protein [Paenibacillus piri]
MSVRPHPFFSGALFARKSCFVYVPEGYDEQSEQRYPVIYLLHGMHGSESHWLQKGSAEQTLDRMMSSCQLRKCIVVMPNDGGYGQGTFYMDWYDGTGNFEQYFIYDLMPDIDKNYRTIQDMRSRAVCGLSMGGFGAFSLSLRNPGLFGAAASLSGALISGANVADNFARRDVGRMTGPVEGPHAKSYDLHRCASRRVSDMQRPALYFDCGTEDALHHMNADYHRHLDRIGYAHTYREFPGEHTWDYWTEHLPDALGFIEQYFGSQDQA